MNMVADICMNSELLVYVDNTANDAENKSTGFYPLYPHYNSRSYLLRLNPKLRQSLLAIYRRRPLSPYTLHPNISTHS
jgi:hypothetical protein